MYKVLLFLCVFLSAFSVQAALWHVDPVTSRLTFEGEQSGEKFVGSFPNFTSAIDFDAAAPEKGSIRITVDMASAQIEGSDRMEALPTGDWFAVKQFATATFVSSGIRAVGADKTGMVSYEAKGMLTIRGVSCEITLPFTLKTVGKSTVAHGSVTLSRADFGVGQGRWKSDEWVKYPVVVRFELHASMN